MRPQVIPQTAYIHPRVDGRDELYFDWIGAAIYAADVHTSAMHGRQFYLESAHAGIDSVPADTAAASAGNTGANLYGRLDFIVRLPEGEFRLVASCSVQRAGKTVRALRLDAAIVNGTLRGWRLFEASGLETSGKTAGGNGQETVLATPEKPAGVEVALATIFEFKLPLALLRARQGDRLSLRYTLWQQGLPVDALPSEGAIRLQIVPEEVLADNIYGSSQAD